MRTKWHTIDVPHAGDSPTVAEMKQFLANNPDLPDDACFNEDTLCCGGPLRVGWHKPWTIVDHQMEAARLRQIDEDEKDDRKAGF